MGDKIKNALLFIGGIVCVIVGVAGVFLPIIPGVPILLLGLHLIGVRIPLLDRWTQRFKAWLLARQKQTP